LHGLFKRLTELCVIHLLPEFHSKHFQSITELKDVKPWHASSKSSGSMTQER